MKFITVMLELNALTFDNYPKSILLDENERMKFNRTLCITVKVHFIVHSMYPMMNKYIIS